MHENKERLYTGIQQWAGDTRHARRILVGKPERKGPLRQTTIILYMNLARINTQECALLNTASLTPILLRWRIW